MNIWKQLPASIANKFFHVSLLATQNSKNKFYYNSLQPWDKPEYDGPWSLISFIPNLNIDGVVTVYINNVEFEALEFEEFDPLFDYGSFLVMRKNVATDLAKLLLEEAKNCKDYPSIDPKAVFTKIGFSELKEIGLSDIYFPENKQSFYVQNYDPLSSLSPTKNTTVVMFSLGSNVPKKKLFFRFIHFSTKFIQNSNFNPADDAFARINLDKIGLEELAELLIEQANNLADS